MPGLTCVSGLEVEKKMETTEIEIISEEDLAKKQKHEAKQLQGRIQKLKHSVPKGDKKRKKDILTEIEKLESDQRDRHADELKQLLVHEHERRTLCNELDDVTKRSEELSVDDVISPVDTDTNLTKKSKAQRRKARKQEEEHAKEDRIRVCEEESVTGARNLEAQTLEHLLDQRNLMIHEIPSDGNCLYSAVVDQLSRCGVTSSIESLRRQTAAIMRNHGDDYLPFLTSHSSGLPLSNDEYETYLHELENTPAWGGQVEIRALSIILEKPIEVVQADGPCIHIGQEYDKPSLILTYHRHVYGLGEHFNSVLPKVEQEEAFTTVTS